jgi:hypothetical protein
MEGVEGEEGEEGEAPSSAGRDLGSLLESLDGDTVLGDLVGH